MSLQAIWKNRIAAYPESRVQADNKVRRGSGSPAVSVDKRMDPIGPPQHVCSHTQRVSFGPMAINAVNHVIHERRDPEMLRRHVFADPYVSRPVLARIGMQASDGVEIQGFDYSLRQESGLDLDGYIHQTFEEIELPRPILRVQFPVSRITFVTAYKLMNDHGLIAIDAIIVLRQHFSFFGCLRSSERIRSTLRPVVRRCHLAASFSQLFQECDVPPARL